MTFKERKFNRIKELTDTIETTSMQLHDKPIVTMAKLVVLVNELRRVVAFKENTFPNGGINI